MAKNEKWVYSRSALKYHFKKIQGFEDWFYTGPTKHFGHYPPGGNKR